MFGLSAYEAARKLAADLGLDPDKPPMAGVLRKTQYPMVREFRQEELHCRRVLCDYLHLLEDWKMKCAPKSPEEKLDDRYVEACQMLDYIEYLADLHAVGELEQRVKAVELLRKDCMITELEKRLKNLEKGERNAGDREGI